MPESVERFGQSFLRIESQQTEVALEALEVMTDEAIGVRTTVGILSEVTAAQHIIQ